MSPRTRKPPDPRHCQFQTQLTGYWYAEQNEVVPDLPWSAGDAGALSSFLRANPSLTIVGFRRLLQHRLDSEDHARGEPVKLWIGSLTRYANGPLNQYKQPKKGGQDGKRTRADERNQHAAGATAAALRRIQGLDRD